MSLPNLGPKNKDGSNQQPQSYDDGRTKQAFADEANIVKIMARAEKAGTISHLDKFEGVYVDYSNFDFQEQTNQLARGNSIFAELPGEIRQEFAQSPTKFFAYVNDPANKEDLRRLLPGLAKPGNQLIQTSPPDADTEAAEAAAGEAAGPKTSTVVEPTTEPDATGGV